MCTPRLFLVVPAVLVGLSLPASSTVSIEWVTVGDPGNPCGRWYGACHGVVAQVYRISKTEVTNAQYAEFLNAVAATDTNALYNTDMAGAADGAAPKDRPGSSARRAIEGRQHKLPPPLPSITRSGSPGSFEYQAAPGRERRPVNFVSYWDALRFANWLHNGQPVGAQDDTTTEDGAYTLTPADLTSNGVERNADVARAFVPSFDEWFKAAYYEPGSRRWFHYPTGSDAVPTCAPPGATPNTANCQAVVADLTDAGSYTGSASPNGTYDQGGNVYEWTEAVIKRSHRIMKGGSWHRSARALRASGKHRYNSPDHESRSVGFRVASRAPSADGS